MNIVVKPYGQKLCYCRPDTTWERENRDFYVPQGIVEIHWTPIIFARISKAGKFIGKKFVSRYYDAFNFGALLYCRTEDCTADTDIAFTSCADHTSLLPFPLYNTIVKNNEGNEYIVEANGVEAFKVESIGIEFEEAICKASELTSLRIGDFVAMELAPAELLASEDDAIAMLKGSYCGNILFDTKIIF